MREHFDRLAAENNRRHTATPVRGHHDQIALSRRGCIDNCLIDLFVLDVRSVSQANPILNPIAMPAVALKFTVGAHGFCQRKLDRKSAIYWTPLRSSNIR